MTEGGAEDRLVRAGNYSAAAARAVRFAASSRPATGGGQGGDQGGGPTPSPRDQATGKLQRRRARMRSPRIESRLANATEPGVTAAGVPGGKRTLHAAADAAYGQGLSAEQQQQRRRRLRRRGRGPAAGPGPKRPGVGSAAATGGLKFVGSTGGGDIGTGAIGSTKVVVALLAHATVPRRCDVRHGTTAPAIWMQRFNAPPSTLTFSTHTRCI